MVTLGRGAWSKDGGTTPYYEIYTPNVGSQAVKDPSLDPHSFDYRAVNYGVKAIQARLNEMGYLPSLQVDGWFGPATSQAVKWAQNKLGLVTVYTPGRVGSTLSKALFKPLVINAQTKFSISSNHLGGIMVHESSSDPGAVGYYTHWDKGLFQWNCDPANNPSYTIAQAFDYHWAITATAQRVAAAQVTYASKGAELQAYCSIAQHNSPLYAAQWFSSGSPPNPTIKEYVDDVLLEASRF